MFCHIQIVIITNFIIVSSVGIKRVDCISGQHRPGQIAQMHRPILVFAGHMKLISKWKGSCFGIS